MIWIYEKVYINLAVYVPKFLIPTYLQAKNMYIVEVVGLWIYLFHIHQQNSCALLFQKFTEKKQGGTCPFRNSVLNV